MWLCTKKRTPREELVSGPDGDLWFSSHSEEQIWANDDRREDAEKVLGMVPSSYFLGQTRMCGWRKPTPFTG